MDERINILIGSDINYAPYYGVMLTSLFMNNKESLFDVYLLTDTSWTQKETEKFETLCANYHSAFVVKIVDKTALCDFPKAGHITLPTYYRLQAANLLPESVHKILYLDGDMIVLGDIRPLWNIDLTDMAFAGVEDEASVLKDNYIRLGYNERYGYYNAGVSLYNLDYWRQNGLSEKTIQFIVDNPNKIKWMDQDVVNAMLYDKRVVLPLKWNFQVCFCFHKWWNLYDDSFKNNIKKQFRFATIIHYNGNIKPWSYRYYGCPFHKEWLHYMKISNWHVNIYNSLKDLLKYLIFRVFMPNKLYRIRNTEVEPFFWNE